MSDRSDDRAFPGRLWLRLGVVWVLLMALLGITLATSYLRLGGSGAILQLGIAGLQVLLIWLLFMNLIGASPLLRLCAISGLTWLIFFFSLTFADYFTRPWNGGGTSLSQRAADVGSCHRRACPGDPESEPGWPVQGRP